MSDSDFTHLQAQLLAHFDAPDSGFEARFDDGIRRHRMGHMRLRVVDSDGAPVPNTVVTIRQTRHDFIFGSNLFQLGGYASEEQNQTYERAFLEIFNSGVVPFYWGGLEPVRGQPRFAADSPPISRRPPPDLVTDFCERHGVTPKGHCLVWHRLLPDWLPADPAQAGRLNAERIRALAGRYGKRIHTWDVVNEPMERFQCPEVTQLSGSYMEEAYACAAEAFPEGTRLFLNEATQYSWRAFQGHTTGLHLLEDNLRLRGCRIDGLGLQYHFFFYDRNGLTTTVRDLINARDELLNPARLLDVLDLHASAFPDRPVHISEITIPVYPDLPPTVAEKLQAALARRLYRLWFSHPGVEAIYWWNLADGMAHGREGDLRAALLREDLSPKPVYETLRRLIREEWTTRLQTRTDDEGTCEFSGFYGDYQISLGDTDGCIITHRAGLHKNRVADYTLSLDCTAANASGPTQLSPT
jgi:GH35 family endo-1,4-beta-xylanase